MMTGTLAVLLQLVVASASDDARLLRDVRAAQSRFESVRRAHLRRDFNGGASGRCDARIGRFCYWYDSTESSVAPEAQAIVTARGQLLAFLDSAATRAPADAWVAGQRTRYLMEADRMDDAVVAARSCRAEAWWCAALEGLALHVSQRYASADSAFGVALVTMPATQRCEWLDLRRLLADAPARDFGRATCAERPRQASRLWALSQPLWSTSGNDLRTEHFARLTMATILAHTPGGYGLAWGDDSRELLLRYGWVERYSRQERSAYMTASPGVLGHDREPSYAFYPDIRLTAAVPRVSEASWQLREPTAHSRYSPRHISRIGTLPHQLIRMPRGDSMLLTVVTRVADTALARDTLRAVLAVLLDTTVVSRRAHATTLALMVPRDTMVASIEVLGASTKRAARARYTIDPLMCEAEWCVSDLLLFDARGGAHGGDIERVLRAALADPAISNRVPLGVLWETQGEASAKPMTLSLTVSPVRVSLGRRLASGLHLTTLPAPVSLRWQAPLKAAREAQSVTLRLPPTARGRYRVRLTVERPGAPPLSASREIVLTP